MSDKRRSIQGATRRRTGFDQRLAGATKTAIPISKITLDPRQPRRAMPDYLRFTWLNDVTPESFFEDWIAHAIEEQEDGLNGWQQSLEPSKHMGTTPAAIDTAKLARMPYTRSWLELVGLAAAIHHEGLLQPIGVYGSPTDGYKLLFGERRYMAYQLLNWHFDKESKYERILCAVLDEYSAFAQAYENGSHEQLSAIGKARQLALILMDMNPDSVEPFEGSQPSWEWYQQAVDFRVAHGQQGRVTEACGFKTRQQVGQYRNLLNIEPAVAEIADEMNWTEGKLRGMMRTAEATCQQLLTIAQIEAGLQERPKPADEEKIAASAQRAVKGVQAARNIKVNQKWNSQQRKDIDKEIDETIAWLRELKRGL